MAAGKVLVVSNAGGIPEILGDPNYDTFLNVAILLI